MQSVARALRLVEIVAGGPPGGLSLSELARTLGWLPSHLRIYGIEGKRFAMGTQPSPAVLRGIQRTAQEIARIVAPRLLRLGCS